MNIKTEFSIKDLESLSGIKAHTIRIWEKRYGLLEPKRSDTNIRSYDIDSLQKILNISLLNNNGFKVSKIAKLSPSELNAAVLSQLEENQDITVYLNQLKLSMLTFDGHLFNKTFAQLSDTYPFEELFLKVFIPFLEIIGVLWQTNTITPAHERFVSNLIKQKMLVNMEKLDLPTKRNTSFVLFLPLNESHDLGLLFVNYMLLKNGQSTIYLGQSVPTDNLLEVQKVYDNITFISYLTVQPTAEDYSGYMDDLQKTVLRQKGDSLHVSGRMTNLVNYEAKSKHVYFHNNLQELIEKIVSR